MHSGGQPSTLEPQTASAVRSVGRRILEEVVHMPIPDGQSIRGNSCCQGSSRTCSNRLGRFLGGVGMLVALAGGAHADCLVDSSGQVYCGSGRCLADRTGAVWCSRFFIGDAVRARDGTVICGPGQCTTDGSGQVYCSSAVGGAVLRDSAGRVRCYVSCVRASKDYCERSVADVGN